MLAMRLSMTSCKRLNFSRNTKTTVSKPTFSATLECCPSEQSLRTSVHVFSVLIWRFLPLFCSFLLFCHSEVTNRLVGACHEDLRSEFSRARLADVYKKDEVQKFVANHRGKIGRTSGRIDHPSIRECAQSMRLMRFRSRIDT